MSLRARPICTTSVPIRPTTAGDGARAQSLTQEYPRQQRDLDHHRVLMMLDSTAGSVRRV